MINKITSKRADPNGDLDKIFSNISVRFNPEKALLQGSPEYQLHAIIVSQLQEIESVLELAELNLIQSSKLYTNYLCRKMYTKTKHNVNLKEKLSGDFLLNSIIYYNASFDYLRILIRLIYSSSGEIRKDYPINKIKKELVRLRLLENDWFLALGSLVTKQHVKDFSAWISQNKKIPQKVKGKYERLRQKNEKIRKEYQANQLKHGAIPCFNKTDKSNILGSRYLVRLNQFYNCSNKRGLIRGWYWNLLNIDKTQKFLIGYHNTTVALINCL